MQKCADEDCDEDECDCECHHFDGIQALINGLSSSADKIEASSEPAINAFLEKHPEFKLSITNGSKVRLNRKQKHRTKCITSDEIHSKENACIYSYMGKLYARCFFNNKNLVIGSPKTAEFEPPYTYPIEKLVNVRLGYKVPIEKYGEIVKDKTFIVDIRSMGSAKSFNSIHHSKDAIENEEGKKVLL